eukprot:jgi/Ulvmu1/899/UM101_0007.1
MAPVAGHGRRLLAGWHWGPGRFRLTARAGVKCVAVGREQKICFGAAFASQQSDSVRSSILDAGSSAISGPTGGRSRLWW